MKKVLSFALAIALLFSLAYYNISVAEGAKQDILLWLPPFAAGEGALDHEFWTKALAPWAEKNNVNLNVEITPWANYEEKYLTAFSSGSGPDVGYMYLEMFNEFIDMGAIAPLDEYITDADRENYLYLDKGFIKGKQYAMPFVVGNARILFFNMDILDKAGVKQLPSTWTELVEVATKVKEANIEGVMPFAAEWADPTIGALNNIYYPYLWQAGGDIYNKDASQIALMDNDAAVRAAQFLYDLKSKYKVLPEEAMALTGSELRNQFIEGNIAVASMAANSAARLDKANIRWDYVTSLQDKTKATWIAADSLIVNNASKHKELAVELVRYITSKEIMEQFHKEISPFPPITKDAKFLDNPRFEKLYAETQYLHTLPVASGAFKVMDTLYKNLQSMMLDEITPEQAIQNTVDYAKVIQ